MISEKGATGTSLWTPLSGGMNADAGYTSCKFPLQTLVTSASNGFHLTALQRQVTAQRLQRKLMLLRTQTDLIPSSILQASGQQVGELHLRVV